MSKVNLGANLKDARIIVQFSPCILIRHFGVNVHIKARLAHGQFGTWLEREFDFGSTTALKFMQVAERFGENTRCVNFTPAILYVLAAPATPEAVREAAIAMVQAGQAVTLADVDAPKREAQCERETRQQFAALAEQHSRAAIQQARQAT